jgi:predicted Zn-dependent protease
MIHPDMKRMKHFGGFFLILALLVIGACAKVPITGRRQMKLLPVSTLNSMSLTEYQKFISTHKLCTDANKVELVRRVGGRIERAVTNYFKVKGQTKYLAGYRWEYNVVEDPTVNAWCMPGGKVVVYTGLLPVTQNEDALAVVMGHEIAHAIANHGNERMSQGLAMQAGGVALSVALSSKSPETQDLFLKAYGVGANVGAMLPFSRMHESEADEMGLIFMAMAGYKPDEAIAFWKRMSNASSGQKPPEFLSTHPSDATRIARLQKVMPKAKLYAQKYGIKP